MSDILIVLLVLLGLQAKHLLADFVLQTPYMLANRRHYGHPGGLLHAGVHMGLSAVVLAVFGTPVLLLAGLVLAEGVVHYHIDWIKDNYAVSRHLTPQKHAYWVAMGVDQALHHATYLAMVWVWAAAMLG